MKGTVILVTKETLGTTHADDAAFGVDMLDKFFHALEGRSEYPKAICFYTEGVKTLVKGSPYEAGLRILNGLGVQLIVCRSCVEYYDLGDFLAVGKLCGMPDIVGIIAEADKVVTV